MRKKSAQLIALTATVMLIFSACDKPPVNDPAVTDDNPNVFVTDNTDNTDVTAQEPKIEPWVDKIPDKCTSRYGYNFLDASEKAVYDKIVDAAKHYETEVVIDREISKSRLEEICEMIFIEENALYYLSDEYTVAFNADTGSATSVTLSYKYDHEELAYLNTLTEERIELILEKITDDMSEVDKIKLFHDEIVFGCKYEADGRYTATPFGALVDGKALCEGYARAMALLCNKVGIENMFATGTQYNTDENGVTTEEEHIWNMIKINGLWYNMDVTWDDPASIKNGRELEDDYISYSYFLIPSNELRPTLSIRTDLVEPPSAYSNESNYFVYYGYYAETYEQTLKILEKSIKESNSKGDKYVRIKFATPALYKEATNKLFRQKEIYSICPDILPKKIEFFWNETAKCIQFSIR